MAFLQTLILTLLVTLFSSVLGITSEKDQVVLYEQFEDFLFAEAQELADDRTFVTRVVDGDTIVVSDQGEEKKVRLLGIDTPETVDPRKEVECFGREASEEATRLLVNKEVRLESDASQGDVDKYGRLLRYVYLQNGLHVNLALIKKGYAHEYTYDLPYQYQAEFKEAQAYAKQNKLGLWGDICNFEEKR